MSASADQFRSLDYADIELAGAILDRPSTATPLNIPLPRDPLSNPVAKEKYERALKQSYQDEVARNAQIVNEQYQAQQQQELLLREKQVARNQALSSYKTPSVEEGFVRSKSYEYQYEMPKSTIDSQPKPSSAKPPVTPANSGARGSAKLNPITEWNGVGLQEAIPAEVSLPKSTPRSLPIAAGKFPVIPAAMVALDFGNRVFHGQSPAQAGFGAAGSLGGSLLGATVGSAFGPVGTIVGGMIGGAIGGGIADYVWSLSHPTSEAARPVEPVVSHPFFGGQSVGVLYSVQLTFEIRNSNGQITDYSNPLNQNIRGPIKAIYITDDTPQHGAGSVIVGTNEDGTDQYVVNSFGSIYLGTQARNLKIIFVNRQDGQIDYGGNPTSIPIPTDFRSPESVAHPANSESYVSRGTPGGSQTSPLPNNSVSAGTPENATPRPTNDFQIPGGYLAPRINPNPFYTPSNLGGNLPEIEPTKLPGFSGNTTSSEFTDGNDFTRNQAIPGSIINLSSGSYVQVTSPDSYKIYGPATTPQPQRQEPVADALKPIPTSSLHPIPKDTTTSTPTGKDYDDLARKVLEQGNQLAIITLLLQQLPKTLGKDNDFRNDIKEPIKGAVCDISQPNGCLGKPINDVQNQANQNSNKLDALNAAFNGLDLVGTAGLNGKLDIINNKLGEQLPGGIGGKLTRVAQWMHLDRALNILIWWQTLHNAYMLSANLGQTLTSALSNVLAAIGIKDAEGSPLDIGQILGSQFDSLAKTVIGESEWGSIKAEYKKWNRIYQAAANLLNSIQSIGYSILSALEVVGSWIAVIGNALRKWGEVSEKAYRWMNPTPNFQNKFFTALETTENVVSQIDSVASEVLSVQDTVTQIGTQKAEFLKALGQEPDGKQGTTPPEATQVKAGFDASKLVSATGLAIADEDKEADE
ncbi:hypothetical protein [Calothrix sp. PCC 7507]|uniref:hypothetical protein n=1 Tax=Calothrix sp. PCC 7507 TaxID=99598 RepID=UPI00029F2B0D|nr:hypothetical protein [Calothrix sp. PCC 7507]AFY31609.1 hypothetical protein Cal7507_1135 [Calothrix sp. PCC 7507]